MLFFYNITGSDQVWTYLLGDHKRSCALSFWYGIYRQSLVKTPDIITSVVLTSNNTNSTRKIILGKEKEEERLIVQTLFTMVDCFLKHSKIIQENFRDNFQNIQIKLIILSWIFRIQVHSSRFGRQVTLNSCISL